MKKVLTFLVLFFLPFIVKAEGIEKYIIDTKIQNDGSIIVQEYFNLTGEYNGYERIIEYKNENTYPFDPNLESFGGSSIHNGTGLEILDVKSMPISNNINFKNINGKTFKEVRSADKGDYGVYTVSERTNGKSVLIYNPSKKKQAFYIKYKINNIAIKHNDVGEIGWNVLGSSERESIGNLKIYLHIPNNKNSIRAWAHGPLNGFVNIIDNENVEFSITNLSVYRAIDIRATFDTTVISNSTKTTNVEALDKIILYETDKAAQANYERQNEEKVLIQNIEEALSEFEINVERYNYKYALDVIKRLNDAEKEKTYLERLNKTKLLLDKKEEQDAKESLKDAEKNIEYTTYKMALDDIEVLDNLELKNKYNIRLEKVKKLVIQKEKQMEKENYKKSITYFISIIIFGVLIYIFIIKDPKTDFNETYLREIPEDIEPEVLGYLISKKVTPKSTSATLLSLINRNVIKAEKIKKNNYLLMLDETKKEELTDIEDALIKYIFTSGNSINTKDINKNAKAHYTSYKNRYETYKNLAETKAKQRNYFEYEKNKKYSITTTTVLFIICCAFPPLFIIFIPYLIFKTIKSIIQNGFDFKNRSTLITLGTIIFIILEMLLIAKMITIGIDQHFIKTSIWLYLFLSILLLIVYFFVFYDKKRTEEGSEEYKKWMALKRYLNHFSIIKEREVPEVKLWKKYLVYATVFGNAKKVLKAIDIEELQDIDTDIYRTYIISDMISHTITRSYASAQSTYNYQNSSSSYSSGSGGGGGFSSGGGSFGGGGGGGRF